MIDVERALKLIEIHLPKLGAEELPLESCAGKVLAEDVKADREYPPFNRVMMDGIALAFEGLESGQLEFKVSGIAPAGRPAKKLKSNEECIEVMTGAILPEGADTVIPYEEIEINEGVARLSEQLAPKKFQNIHLQGSDTSKGDLLLRKGLTLNGPHIGICASVGKSVLKVEKTPRVNIISTGDELVNIDKTPKQYQIRKSNAQALRSSLALNGHYEVELDHLNDDPSEIQSHYRQAIKEFDVLIYSGGVSKGKFDYLPNLWVEMGVEKIFHGISQRPGKPLWFGVEKKTNTAIFGLPGNPVSSLVCLHRYFLDPPQIYVELEEDILFKKDLTHFAQVKTYTGECGQLKARPIAIKNSGEFTALAESDGFIELPKNQEIFSSGERFLFFPWRSE